MGVSYNPRIVTDGLSILMEEDSTNNRLTQATYNTRPSFLETSTVDNFSAIKSRFGL